MNREAAIAAWLPEARWFAGKAAGPARVSIHDRATLPQTTLDATLVDVASDSGTDRYWMPLAADGFDAAMSPEFATWVVQMVRAGGRLPAGAGAFRGQPAAAGGRRKLDADDTPAAVVPLGGDASNTSLRVTIGPRDYAVKVLRRCRPGIQPEVEVGGFLAQVGWNGTPPFVGWLDYEPRSGASTVLATVHEFVAGCTTAWDRLVALTRSGGVRGPHGRTIMHLVAALGHTTAEMHRALGSRSDVAAFAPETPPADWAAVESARMAAHAGQVFDAARARLPALSPAVRADVERLLDRKEAIVATLKSLPQAGAAAAIERVHGDYHLGQVLVGEPGPRVFVIDFEGEPGRSLAERRRKTSVCKDVAGMCRSFDYLLRHTAKTGGEPYSAADLATLEATFLEAYRAVATGHDWWPADAAAAERLLTVYRLDKAVYELAYELANRPDWVAVPLAALLA